MESLPTLDSCGSSVSFITDGEGQWLQVGAEWLELSGRTASSACGLGWLEAIHPEQREAVCSSWQEAIATGQAWSTVLTLLHRDGSSRLVLARAMTARAPESAAPIYIGHCVELDHQPTTAEPNDNLGAFKEVLFSEGPVVVIRRRSSKGWPVQQVTPNSVDLLGYCQAELEDDRQDYADLVVEEDRARVHEALGRAAERGLPRLVHAPYRVLRKEGEAIWLYDTTLILRRQNGAVDGYLSYVFDISAQMRVENQVMRAQRLASLGGVAATVAHEFNNQLAGIMGNAGLARRKIAADSAAHKNIDRIEIATNRAAELCRQVLAMSIRSNAKTRPLNLNTMLQEAQGLLALAAGRNVQLHMRLTSRLPTIAAVESRLRQIVVTLIRSAAQAIGDSPGTIQIRTALRHCEPQFLQSCLLVNGHAAGDYVHLEIADTGSGEQAARMEDLFQPPFTTGFAERDLGLASVREIAGAHNAIIQVCRGDEPGCAFSLYFPLPNRSASAEP